MAEQTEHLVLGEVHGDPAQHGNIAVTGAQALDRQDRVAPPVRTARRAAVRRIPIRRAFIATCQIDVTHQRVAQHRIDMAFGEDAALVQHRDGLRQLADKMHVVFDDDDRRARVHLDDDVDGPLGLLRSQSGGRLVEQDQPRVSGQHGAELDELAPAVGQVADRFAGAVRDADTLQRLGDNAVGLAGRIALARGDPDILAHAQAVHHARDLGLDADAEAGDLVRMGADAIDAANPDIALARPQDAGQALEEGALAGAVRADQAAQLFIGEDEIDGVERRHAAEADADPARLHDPVARAPTHWDAPFPPWSAGAGRRPSPRPGRAAPCPASLDRRHHAARQEQDEQDQDDAKDQRGLERVLPAETSFTARRPRQI